jgi:cytochrome oxidase Cu insertion factor (SCO1/SenC/PrrC family)
MNCLNHKQKILMKTFLLFATILIVGLNTYSQEERSAEDAKGLTVGTIAPDFSGIDADSMEFNLSKAIEKGSVVLIFYRGF